MAQSPHISFVALQQMPVKELKGISKTAGASASKGPVTAKYLGELAHAELDADLDATFSKLKSSFKFKRKEISADGPSEGVGVINTPGFFYEVSVQPMEDTFRNIVIKRCIRGICDADQITGEAFFEVFESRFNHLEVASETALDLEAIIDQIEEVEADDISLDYDRDITYCDIGLKSMRTTIEVRPNLITVKGPMDVTPAELIQSFFEMQNCFMDALDLSEPLLRSSTAQ